MKIKQARLSLLLMLVCVSCRAQLEVGKSVDSFIIVNSDSTFYLLSSPAQLEKGYEVVFDLITYRVAVSVDRYIRFIETSDLKFRTEEGAFIGMLYGSIDKEKRKSKVYDQKGWGKVLKLSSGWNAVFDFKEPLTDNSSIQFFYKK